MAISGIPMPISGMDAFNKSLGFDNLMQQILGRNQLKQKAEHEKAQMEQMERHFQQNFGLSKAAAGRAAQAAADAHKASELKTNPKALFEFIQAIKNQSAPQASGIPSQQPIAPFSGAGMPNNEEMQNPAAQQMQQPMEQQPSGLQQQNQMPEGMAQPNQPPVNPEAGGLFGNLTPDQQMMLQMAGIKVPTIKENPEQKRYAELRDKIQLENIKTQQRKALEQEKENLKNEATRKKTMDTAKSDLPHLEDTLSALKKMEKIAKNNPDLFGHSGLFGIGSEGAAERFSKRTDNPNAGAWQTLGLGPIVAAESKMSSKGNILALKSALANKPNFSENQKVALSKIKTNIKQIEKTINDTKKIAGVVDEGNFALMKDPTDGEIYKVPTSDVAKRTAEKWTHVK